MAAGDHINSNIPAALVGTNVFTGYPLYVLEVTGSFVALNTFDMKVNTVAISQVVFTTSHNNTMKLIAASIDALASVKAYIVRAKHIKRILIYGAVSGTAISITDIVIALGATQPVASVGSDYGSRKEGTAIATLEA